MLSSQALVMVLVLLAGGDAAPHQDKTARLESEVETLKSTVSQMGLRLNELEFQSHRVSTEVEDAAPVGLVLFLFGVFCALWAQTTRRSAWLWFFMGFLFSIVAVLVLLAKNSTDEGPRMRPS